MIDLIFSIININHDLCVVEKNEQKKNSTKIVLKPK